MPAAREHVTSKVVISHPGITYGGILHQGWLTGSRAIEVFREIISYYMSFGYIKLIYKAIPYIYTKIPAQDDLFALSILNSKKTSCKLTSTLDLSNRINPSDRRKRGSKKAKKYCNISKDINKLNEFWNILNYRLSEKYKSNPVHTIEEISYLKSCFPDSFELITAIVGDKVVAGVLFFISSHIWHSQYIASDEIGYDISALDAIFEFSIECAAKMDSRYFDFGTSNSKYNDELNESLYRYKTEFGGGGVIHESYELIF